jgi:hypothetical protein
MLHLDCGPNMEICMYFGRGRPLCLPKVTTGVYLYSPCGIDIYQVDRSMEDDSFQGKTVGLKAPI